MTTPTATKPDTVGRLRTSSNGAAGQDSLPLALPRTRRSRAPQALLAALLMVGGGLGGLLLFQQYNQRTPAVVVVEPVAHGEIVGREDLAITEVALDRGVATMAAIDDVVGRFAAHDLQPGELVTPGDLAAEDQLVTEGRSVIGLLLEPGQYPTRRLAPGDRVDVFAPGSASAVGAALAADLAVFDVVESSSDGRTLLVSLVVTSDQAAAVFQAAEDTGVRLSLRGRR
ncbi:MAG: SAF domain-containing protein [Actinomycetota bacterium]